MFKSTGAALRPFLCAVVLSGCSAYNLNVTTIPDGATLYWQQGGQIGAAPQLLNFEANPAYMNGNCFQVQGVTAAWTSGAKAQSSQVILLCNGPGDYHVTLERPANAPGLDADLRVAVMMMQHRIAQEQLVNQYMMEASSDLGEALGRILAQ